MADVVMMFECVILEYMLWILEYMLFISSFSQLTLSGPFY